MKTPLVRLYSLASFDRGAKVRWLLVCTRNRVRSRRVDRVARDLDSPEYLSINPMGRVPALQMDDRVMIESGAICAYLSDRFPEYKMAPAAGTPERMEYDQWMYFASPQPR